MASRRPFLLCLLCRDAKHALHVPCGMENPNTLQGAPFRAGTQSSKSRPRGNDVAYRSTSRQWPIPGSLASLIIAPFNASSKDEPLHPPARFRPALLRRISANASSPSTNSPRSACSLPVAISFRSSASRICFNSSRSLIPVHIDYQP